MCISFPPYFDHDAFIYTMHVLDASASGHYSCSFPPGFARGNTTLLNPASYLLGYLGKNLSSSQLLVSKEFSSIQLAKKQRKKVNNKIALAIQVKLKLNYFHQSSFHLE